MKYSIITLLLFALTTGCDDVHQLIVINATLDDDIEVLYTEDIFLEARATDVKDINGKVLQQHILAPGEEMVIGTVERNYVPEPKDINLDYMEFRYRNDTIVLKGRRAIFSSFRRNEGHKWTYILN